MTIIPGSIYPGSHYCKFLSPARALDWMMTETTIILYYDYAIIFYSILFYYIILYYIILYGVILW